MKAINLHLLTRIRDHEKLSMLYQALSGADHFKMISPHEAASLWSLTDRIADFLLQDPSEPEEPVFVSGRAPDGITEMISGHIASKCEATAWEGKKHALSLLDGFFFSYIIEHIGKEFDLLKISSDGEAALNIELKSEDIGEERIRKQLEQNRYYLSHTARTIYSFTYVMETDRLYSMNERGFLRQCGMEDLIQVLTRPVLSDFLTDGIDRFFRASDYLISPVAAPEKFLQGQYFLTNQQFDFRRKILELLPKDPHPVIGISGAAGTGKTLLLFDLALPLSRKNRVLLIHSGPLRRGHKQIDERLKNVDIRSGYSEILPDLLSGYSAVLIDEADHLTVSAWKEIVTQAEHHGIPIIVTFDPRHLLQAQETPVPCLPADTFGSGTASADISGSGTITADISGSGTASEDTSSSGTSSADSSCSDMASAETQALIENSCTLILPFSGNIRINRPVYAFLHTLLCRKNHAGFQNYGCIDVLYAANLEEASLITAYYQEKGYQKLFRSEAGSTDTVIAQEYDKVLIILDTNYYYDETLHLRAKKEEDSALDLLYEGLSRTRESLCLLVIQNQLLFTQILNIRLGTQEPSSGPAPVSD